MPNPIVKIDGVTVDAMPGTLDVSYSLGQRAGLNVTVKSDNGSYRPVVGKDLELFEGATKLWAGSVDEVDERSITEAAPTGRYYGLRAVSWEQYLDKRFCYNTSTGRPLIYERNFEYTANAGTDTLTCTVSHGLSNGNRVRVKAHANGAIPGGLSATVEYYVISASGAALQLSLTAGGAAVNLTDAGTLDQILITNRAGLIVADLLTDAATSEPLGTSNIDLGAVVDTVIFTASDPVWTKITELAEASGFNAWIDVERELYFKPRTFSTAPFSINNTSGNYRNIRVRTTREDKCNSALVNVDIEQIGYEDESFTGDGTTVKWSLANPVGQIVRIQVNSEDKEFAQWLTDSDRAYYYELGKVYIRQDSDETVLTASDTLRVVYRKFGANTIAVEDASDISTTATLEGASGIYAMPFDRPGIGQQQAAAEGLALVSARKNNAVEITYETDQQVEATCHTLRPGQLQTIANSYFNVSSGTYLIREVSLRDVMGQWLQFTVKAISTNRLGGAVEFWKAIAGGSAGGGATGSFVAGGSTGTGGGSTPIEITLTANTTIASPYTPTAADLLTIYVTQGAGPYTISFDSDFDVNFNTNIPGKSGAVTCYQFRGRADGKWWAVCAPYSVLYE
jgi:hypothetical protein